MPPFAHIIPSEQQHIDALLSLLAARGLPAIADPYAAGLTSAASIEEACRIGVQAEIDNVALYDRLLLAASNDPEVSMLFQALQHASAECHLPAFRHGLEGHLTDSCGGHNHHHGGGGCGCGGGQRRWPLDTQISGTNATL